jgi:hypothetical protein
MLKSGAHGPAICLSTSFNNLRGTTDYFNSMLFRLAWNSPDTTDTR